MQREKVMTWTERTMWREQRHFRQGIKTPCAPDLAELRPAGIVHPFESTLAETQSNSCQAKTLTEERENAY